MEHSKQDNHYDPINRDTPLEQTVYSPDYELEHSELDRTALDCLFRAAVYELLGGRPDMVEDWINAAGVGYGFRIDYNVDRLQSDLAREARRRHDYNLAHEVEARRLIRRVQSKRELMRSYENIEPGL